MVGISSKALKYFVACAKKLILVPTQYVRKEYLLQIMNVHLQQKIPLNEALTFHRGLVLLYCMIIMPTVFKLANQTKKIYEIFN